MLMLSKLGPLTQLIRWFSHFESYRFHAGEIWLTVSALGFRENPKP